MSKIFTVRGKTPGTYIHEHVPPALDHQPKAIQEAWDKLSELMERAEQAEADWYRLSQTKQAAYDADTRAAADAEKEGKATPKRSNVAKWEAELASAKHKTEALNLAVTDVHKEYRATVAAHRDEGLDRADKMLETRGANYQTSISAAQSDYADLQEALDFRAHLAGFPGKPEYGTNGRMEGFTLPGSDGRERADRTFAALAEPIHG